MPLLEETKIFSRSIGVDTEIVKKEMYTIREEKGESITLRPEATASLVRAFLEHNLYQEGGVKKYCYSGPMFRRERPQAGRLRQFHQLGVEAIGGEDPSLDAEVISLASEILIKSGIRKSSIEINHLGCHMCRKEFIRSLSQHLKSYLKTLCPDCQRRFETNPLRVLDCKKESCQATIKGAPKTTDSLCGECRSDFDQLKGYLEELNIKFSLNPYLVRGLDHYTGFVFEIIHPELGAQNALCAGGRYNDLIKKFGGPDIPATGFSFGVERVIIALKKEKVKVEDLPKLDIFLVILGKENISQGLKILRTIREGGWNSDMDFGNRTLKAQLRGANKLGVSSVLIFGEEEKEKGSILHKDMKTGIGLLTVFSLCPSLTNGFLCIMFP